MDAFKEIEEKIKQLEVDVVAKENDLWDKFHALEKRKVTVDDDLLKEWLEEYYLLYPSQKEGEWFVAVPKFLNFSVGWLDHTTKGYNVFAINRYTQWIGGIPEFLRKEIKLESPMKITVQDGNVRFDKGLEDTVGDKFGDFLSQIGRGSARVKTGKEFDLIAKIIEEGSLPFLPSPVEKADLREMKVNFDFAGKYKFQQDAYDTFLKYGAMGLFWMTGAGKSFEMMAINDSLIGRKLLVVPSLTLIEQWHEYFKKYAPRLEEETDIVTYQAYDKIKNNKYIIANFDECHVLPADTFSRFSTTNAKYRLGLSASPNREDGRENLIFALTGYPVGLDWPSLMKILGKHYHDINVYIVGSDSAKIGLTSSLLNKERKTIIFVNELAIGEKIANAIGIPFIHGATKNRMDISRDSKVFVASRVMELGVSIKDLEHIIEADFLFGSKREELQRTGRLFHSEIGKVHDIIMTKDEFENYGKRLHGLVEKGFRINLKPMISGTFKIIKQTTASPVKKRGSSGLELVEELYDEGFFRTEKTFAETNAALEKRGMTGIRQKAGTIFSKLNCMVKTKKLYKDIKSGKKVFVMR